MPNSYTEPVSATDNTKLPTDGSGSMTAAIIWSGAGSANSSNYEILRTTAGIIQTVPSGKSNKMRVAGVDHLTVGADGNGWDWHLGRVDSSAYGRIWCVSSNQDVNLDVPTGGVAHVRVGTVDKLLVDSGGVKPQGTGGTGHVLRQTSANGAISSSALTPSDIPGGLVSGKILATVDTSGTGSITGGGYTTLRFTTATNTIATAGAGYYTLTKAGMLIYELRLIVANSRDLEMRPGLNGANDFVDRKTDTEFVIAGLMPVAIGEYIEFIVYNYGSSVSPTSGRLRATLLAI